MMTRTIECSKCNGTGFIPGYANIKQGICFQCSGNGSKCLTDKQYTKYQKDLAYNEKMYADYEKQIETIAKQEDSLHKADQERKKINLEAYKAKQAYIGSVNETITIQLKVKIIKDSKYNKQYIMQDTHGNSITFYSNEIYTVLDSEWTVKGTIKCHSEYNGYKQTVLKDVEVVNHIDLNELTDEEIDNLLL